MIQVDARNIFSISHFRENLATHFARLVETGEMEVITKGEEKVVVQELGALEAEIDRRAAEMALERHLTAITATLAEEPGEEAGAVFLRLAKKHGIALDGEEIYALAEEGGRGVSERDAGIHSES